MSEIDPTPSAGWRVGREHQLPVRIYYEDTDFTGVVYHANYLRYFERGRSDYFRLAGVSHKLLQERPDPSAFTIIKLAVEYKRAARIDDALLVHTTYDAVKGPRLFVSQKITRGGELLCTAEIVAACIDRAGRARKPPADLIAAITPLLATSP